MSEKENGSEAGQKPVKQFRCGAVSVAVWRREANGKVFWNATPSRGYTVDDGATWLYTDSFGREELPVLAALLNQAFSWITAQAAQKG